MSIKNQTACYRTVCGARLNCYCDVLDESLGPLKVQAKEIARTLRRQGRVVKIERMEDGWYRVFAEPVRGEKS